MALYEVQSDGTLNKVAGVAGVDKVNVDQGTLNANKVMTTDENGNITPTSVIPIGNVTIQSGIDTDGNAYIEFVFPDEEV